MRNRLGRLEYERRGHARSSARTASCSRWAIAIRTAISGRTARSPGATRRPASQACCWSATPASRRRARRCCCPRKSRSREESRWGATFAYTFTDAEQNRDINEHYAIRCSRRSTCIPFIRVQRRGRSIAWWPPVHSRRRGDSCSRASSRWSTPIPRNVISCYCTARRPSRPARRATRSPYDVGRQHGLSVARPADHEELRARRPGIDVPANRRAQRDQRAQSGRLTSIPPDPDGIIDRQPLQHRSATSPACRGRCACPSA